MDRPTECKWCGAGTAPDRWNGWDVSVDFTCGSSFWIEDCTWTCDDECVGGLRDRIQRALETLKTAKRHDFVVNFMSSMQQRDDGDFVEFDDVDQVIEILEGGNDATD